MPGIINKRWTTGPKATIVLYEFSPTLAKIRFNYFMNSTPVRMILPVTEWSVKRFHKFVKIYLNEHLSSVMELWELDQKKIIKFTVERISPRCREEIRAIVKVYAKEGA